MASRFPDVSTVCVPSAVILSCVNFVSSAPFIASVDSILVSWAEDLIQGLNYTHSPFVGGATCRECSLRLNCSSPQVSLIITYFFSLTDYTWILSHYSHTRLATTLNVMFLLFLYSTCQACWALIGFSLDTITLHAFVLQQSPVSNSS